MNSTLPTRPTTAAVDACLEGHYATDREQVLAAELRHARECIERCRSVQRVNGEAAKEWEQARRDEPESAVARSRAIVYREVSAELGKALEGF